MAAAGLKVPDFALQLYKALGSGNVFFSPHSIASALMLVALGAKGDTKKQIIHALGLDEDGDANETFKELNNTILATRENGDIEMKLANKLYYGQYLKVGEEFIKSFSDFCDGAIESVDFTSNPEDCRVAINKWIEEQTNDKIKDLLIPGSITANTEMVVTNAIYFKGLWENPFKTQSTTEMDYNVTLDEKVKVQMMKASLQLSHITNDDLGLSAVAIPYQGRNLCMIILLPNKTGGLEAIERTLTPDCLQDICNSLMKGRKYGVDISLPKFKLTVTSELTNVLQKVGISDLFNSKKVDLSGMFESRGAPITEVIHKAFIEVNEEGTEAAAATAMMSRMMFLPVENVQFRCDRPFMFYLVENSSTSILFMGKLQRPV